MDVLDEARGAPTLSPLCQPVFDCSQKLVPCKKLHAPCSVIRFSCPHLGCGDALWWHLHDSLLQCGPAFYKLCPGFTKIGPVCVFDPLIDAIDLEGVERVKTIEALTARIEVLEKRLGK